jgi:hypothetical protein
MENLVVLLSRSAATSELFPLVSCLTLLRLLKQHPYISGFTFLKGEHHMRSYLATSNNNEPGESFAVLLAVLEAHPGVVLRTSFDDSKKEPGATTGTIDFFADEKAAREISEQVKGWYFVRTHILRDHAPDNNAPIETLGPEPTFTDHRVKQPELAVGMTEFLLVGGKAGTDFNAAAVVLLKEPSVRLTGWEDHSTKADSSLSGMFTVAANDRKTVEALARKLPKWVIAP